MGSARKAKRKIKKTYDKVADSTGDVLEKTRDTSVNFTKSVKKLTSLDIPGATESFIDSVGSATSIVYDPNKNAPGLEAPAPLEAPDADSGFSTDPELQNAIRKKKGRSSRIKTSRRGLAPVSEGSLARRNLLAY